MFNLFNRGEDTRCLVCSSSYIYSHINVYTTFIGKAVLLLVRRLLALALVFKRAFRFMLITVVLRTVTTS
jgi:hypothetical protein